MLNRQDLIYPELSYEIIGASFKIYNKLDWGHKEIYYQRALAEELEKRKIPFIREKSFSLEYNGKIIGKYFFDFLVDNKVILELKTVTRLGYANIKQVAQYLKVSNLELAILIYFTKDGVKYRRVLNPAKSHI